MVNSFFENEPVDDEFLIFSDKLQFRTEKNF